MPALTYKLWTAEEDNLLRQVVDGKSNFTELRDKYFPDRTPASLQGRTRKLGIDNPYKSRSFYQNDNFWAEPNKINSYWAGLALADVCITKDSKTGNPQTFKWECSVQDENMMKQFIQDSEFTGKIRYTSRIMEKTGYISKLSSIYINSKQWNLDLDKVFNITPNKAARIKPPENLSKELSLYLLRGYTDGDGCVNLVHNTVIGKKGMPRERYNLSIGYVSSSFEMVQWIKDLLEQNLFAERNVQFNIRKFQKYHQLVVNGQRAIQLFLLLSKLDCYCLERKWKQPKVLEYIKGEIARRPEAYAKFLDPISHSHLLPVNPFAGSTVTESELTLVT